VSSIKQSVRDALVQLAAPVASALHRERPLRRVLTLHEVPASQAQAFEAKLRWLTTWANVVSLTALHDATGLADDRLNVAITFDDGYKDCAEIAAPALAALGLPATVFVCSSAVGLEGDDAQRFAREGLQRSSTVEFMNADDLQALVAGGLFEVGGHAAGHVDLGLPHDPAQWRAQVVDDRARLTELTGEAPRFFAYPFGQLTNISPDAMRWVLDAGYDAAFTIIPSFWSADRDPLLVGRDSLDATLPNALWRAWLGGGYDALSVLRTRRADRRLRGRA
jgi:peptidoglycan/xylan/chitin deacetylase (PgdA/CDA1 family)